MKYFLNANEMNKKTLDDLYTSYEPYILEIQKHMIDAKDKGYFGVYFTTSHDEYNIVVWLGEYLISLGYNASFNCSGGTQEDETQYTVHLYVWWSKYKYLDKIPLLTVNGLL